MLEHIGITIGVVIQMSFLRGLWRGLNILRLAVLNLLVVAALISLLVLAFSSDEPEVPDEAVLVLRPGEFIVEQRSRNQPFESLFTEQEAESESVLAELLEAVNRAKEDERIQLLVLDLRHLLGARLAQLEALGRAIGEFREAGKPVYAYAQGYSQTQYWLAMQADQLLLGEAGSVGNTGVFLRGFGSYPVYMKDALDHLKIGMHVFRVGEYKSAVEPFIRNNMSEEARENARHWLGDLWNRYQEAVAERRDLAGPNLDYYINNYDQLLAEADNDPGRLAVHYGLADRQLGRHGWRELLDETSEPEERIDHRHYLAALDLEQERQDGEIGLIVASGNILPGRQPEGAIGGRSLGELLRRARLDEDVQAVVLRIDSGGGSAHASEMIRQEIAVLREQGKPVVVSMGGVAASGGYWVAAGADRILAEQTSITGSIGIFALVPGLEKTFDTIGLHVDGVGTTRLADAGIPSRPLNPILANIIQQSVDEGYEQFIRTVADGRELAPEQVRELAAGRVYSGRQALELGLVDQLGGTGDAVSLAASLVELEDYAVKHISRELSFREQVFQLLMEASWWPPALRMAGPLGELPRPWRETVETLAEPLESLKEFSDPQGLYMRCLDCRLN